MWRLQNRLRELRQVLVGSVLEFCREQELVEEIMLLEEAQKIFERASKGEPLTVAETQQLEKAWMLVGGKKDTLPHEMGWA
ncbi:MAG: hypothetical protein ACFFDP_08255 [Promethearchaeota archaeon]